MQLLARRMPHPSPQPTVVNKPTFVFTANKGKGFLPRLDASWLNTQQVRGWLGVHTQLACAVLAAGVDHMVLCNCTFIRTQTSLNEQDYNPQSHAHTHTHTDCDEADCVH